MINLFIINLYIINLFIINLKSTIISQLIYNLKK